MGFALGQFRLQTSGPRRRRLPPLSLSPDLSSTFLACLPHYRGRQLPHPSGLLLRLRGLARLAGAGSRRSRRRPLHGPSLGDGPRRGNLPAPFPSPGRMPSGVPVGVPGRGSGELRSQRRVPRLAARRIRGVLSWRAARLAAAAWPLMRFSSARCFSLAVVCLDKI